MDNANADHKRDEDVTYNVEWDPALNKMHECISSEQQRTSCLSIQGQFDVLKFSPEVVAAFGSMEAAQMARARARALMVSSKLHEMGIPANRLRIIPPKTEPTFRGVLVSVVENCISESPEVPDWAKSPEALRDVLGYENDFSKHTGSGSEDKQHLEKSVSFTPEKGIWLSGRAGVIFPFGALYHKNDEIIGEAVYEDVATLGPSIEVNAGFFFKKNYVLFAFWEHAWFGSGANENWQNYGGGQDRQTANFLGIGGRATLDLGTRAGLNFELGASYHWLTLKFGNGTEMNFASPIDTRIGLGIHYRFSDLFSLETMLLSSGGVYSLKQVEYPDGKPVEIGGDNRFHAFLGLIICGNFSVDPSSLNAK